MKYIYGPVNSRRIGRSLGVSLTDFKTCNFDCVYCQLGRTRNRYLQRKEYVKIEEIFAEFSSWMECNPDQAKELDYVTLSGTGEPLLNIRIDELIRRIKKATTVPVCVITNSSLLSSSEARQQLLQAELIIPSLDAVTDAIFQAIDRPDPQIKVGDIISGLIELRKEFKGKIWLEVMLIKGMNDSPAHIRRLKEAIDQIKPDKVQLNSPARNTAEAGALKVDDIRLKEIQDLIGPNCEIF
ncbi:MAG: radical SAM protein [Candidatus Omnitrophica bacterium]|jgi:wyosine [tRNA(Phe)-imidazoG37] synthetase (radical SAM superfamily)|nr:radical SAM protein [Candidatus Omnitrophota bacterium]MDD5079919.1 radical SAM protein [Candidatus Omnitrophota bacterium]